MRRFCPVPSVRAGETDAVPSGLSDSLAVGTKDVHDSSDAFIRSKMPLVFSQPALWAALLSQFFHVYAQLEEVLAKASASDARLAALNRPFFARLARADAFLVDVAFHSRGAPSPPLPATLAYTKRLSEVAVSKPLLLMAYAQTLYVALLAGGQTMAAFMRTARGLSKGEGDAIFDFPAIPAAEHRRFRAALREAVDALGETLTAAERSALLEEKRSIFLRNDAVIKAVLASAQGSVVKAVASIALNTLRAPVIHARRMQAGSLLALTLLILAVLAARCARARPTVASATKGGASGSGASQPGVDDWIARWKDRKSSGDAAPPPRSAEEVFSGPDPRTGFRYVFAGGLSAEACAFNALILRDALEPQGVRLHTTQLMPQKGSNWTLSGALRTFEEQVAAVPGDQPLRLIGTSTGALVCALYAERNPEAVDSLFLMSPTFNLRSCLERAAGGEEGLRVWRADGVAQLEDVSMEWAAVADVESHPAYPFVRCRAYVAHGNLDGFADTEDSLTWVRHASVNMRRRGMPTDRVPERRMLEVEDDHALAASVPQLSAKLLEWYGLKGVTAGEEAQRVKADLEARRPEDFARGHGSNFEVYRNWLISQGFDPDDMD